MFRRIERWREMKRYPSTVDRDCTIERTVVRVKRNGRGRE